MMRLRRLVDTILWRVQLRARSLTARFSKTCVHFVTTEGAVTLTLEPGELRDALVGYRPGASDEQRARARDIINRSIAKREQYLRTPPQWRES